MRSFFIVLITILSLGLVAVGCNDKDRDNVTTMTAPPPATTFPAQTLPTGQVGVPYSYQLRAEGGTQPYVFEVGQGALPSGVNLSVNGVVGGIPTAAGTYPVIFVVNSSGQFSTSITIDP
jgi:hypothetical protein